MTTLRALLSAVVLVLAVAATFASVLDNEFVYDDTLLIVDDPAVRLPLSAGGEGLHYRPLRTFSYRLDYALGGMNPWIFHLSNIAYHALAVLMVHALLMAIGASPLGALAGALVFAVHPVQADAVSYAAGRRDVLCGLFYALGVLAFLRYRREGGRLPLMVAALSCVLAILAKEMAVTMPLVCVLIDRWQARGSGPQEARGEDDAPKVSVRRRFYLLALVAVSGFAVALTYGSYVLRLATKHAWHGGSFAANFATVARIWFKYVQLLLWPAALSADYSYDAFPVSNSAADPRAVLSAVALAALAWLGWVSWRRGGRLGLGMVWVAVTLLPVSHIIPMGELLAEHYLYIPMIGAAIVVSGPVDAARIRWPNRRWVLSSVLAMLIVAAAMRTVVRNRDWHDRLSLWSATVAVVPQCARAQFNLGQAYFERSRLVEAERAWLAASAIRPNDLENERALATVYYRLAKYDMATTRIEKVLAVKPEDGEALTLAGWIALDGGRFDRALMLFDRALAVLSADKADGARRGRERARGLLSEHGFDAAPRIRR